MAPAIPMQTAGIVVTTLAAATVLVALVVSAVSSSQRAAMPWRQAMAVETLARARGSRATAATRRSLATAQAAGRTAQAAVHQALHPLFSGSDSGSGSGCTSKHFSTRVEIATPFPCVTVTVPTAEDQRAAVAPLVAAGFVPKKGNKEFTRDGAVVRVRTQGTTAPALPWVPSEAQVALRALDDLFGGRHYLQTKSVADNGLEAGDGPAVDPGDLCKPSK